MVKLLESDALVTSCHTPHATQVRETQDHGPINTWDRQTYVMPDDSLYPQWNHISRNLIMNGPSGNRDLGNLFPAVDNDDGSAYYWIASNVVAYGGFKNFLGRWRHGLCPKKAVIAAVTSSNAARPGRL